MATSVFNIDGTGLYLDLLVLADELQPAGLQLEEGGAAIEVLRQGHLAEVGVLAAHVEVVGGHVGGLAGGHETGDAGLLPRRPHRCAGLEDVPR